MYASSCIERRCHYYLHTIEKGRLTKVSYTHPQSGNTDCFIISTTPEGEPAFHHAIAMLAAVTSRWINNRKARAKNTVCQRRKVMRAAILLATALKTVLLFTESKWADLSVLRGVTGTYRKRQHTDTFQNISLLLGCSTNNFGWTHCVKNSSNQLHRSFLVGKVCEDMPGCGYRPRASQQQGY